MTEKLPSEKLDVQLIALDLDDTLLTTTLSITPETVSALRRSAAVGIYIVLCSGRTENAILPYIRKLSLAGMQQGRYLIAMNGSSIFDLHKRVQVYTRTVPPEILSEIYDKCIARGLPAQVYSPDTIYASADNRWTRLDAKLCSLELSVVPDFRNFLQKGHPKMVIPGEPAELAEFQSYLKKKFGDRAVIFISKPYFLEIMPAGAGKGEALEWLASHLEIPMEKTMAFGDSMNDESMIRKAGFSVAMCNGCEYIKRIADFVTRKSNESDGIADFLENFVL